MISSPFSHFHPSLHLIQHARQGRLYVERLYNLIRTDKRIFTVLQETRALMVADKFDERVGVGFPVARKAIEVVKDRIHSQTDKQRDRVFGVLVEIRVE